MGDLAQQEFNPLKILHHVDRLRALAAGDDVAPVTVEIDPVADCNHACSWCVDPVHRPVTLARETFEALARELAAFTVGGFDVQGIVLKGGGEPTLHPEFGGLVEHAASLSFALGVVTNGSRLKCWAGVLADHAAYVRISLDGPTPESHALVHRSDDFAEVVAGVRELVARRAGRRHPVLGLSFAMDTRTVAHAPAAIQLGERLGVDYVLLRPPFFEEVGRAPTMTIAEAEGVRRLLARAAQEHTGPLLVQVGQWVGDVEQAARPPALGEAGRRDLQRTPALPVEHRTGRCLASPLLAVVTADGTLYGCCNLRALPEWAFGRLDYARGVGFRALWEGAERAAVLARMHRTECIRHCTHPLARYNEMIEVLRDAERPHAEFV
jgi:MoaA/NifB/PqqE/SkfB family radical SAM enzyme